MEIIESLPPTSSVTTIVCYNNNGKAIEQVHHKHGGKGWQRVV